MDRVLYFMSTRKMECDIYFILGYSILYFDGSPLYNM